MDFSAASEYCLSRPQATLDHPFGPEVQVFKVRGKMFALLSRCNAKGSELGPAYAGCAFLNLKCDPDEAIMLRDIFAEVLPAYHMSKRHWNSVVLVDSMPEKEIERLIDRSYGLVVKSLKKSERLQLELHYPAEQLYR
ncbi:MmcQ/YjbR family DNA-binding protein [Neptuniibacter halophilus]|uniref:MmcQ/YjbR family DNA-binding protein n=1 Tax=Neptuniibacter halophilus TaxID=651666 RepID=UPI0025740EE1|nr:MmcQ/YjbR family DNA-binding protein [Neptuniibacter halophilus]